MALVSRDGNKIIIHVQVYEKDRISQVPGANWDRALRAWRAPLSWPTCLVLRGLFGNTLEIDESLTEWSWQEYQDRIKPALDIRDVMALPADHEMAPLLDKIEHGSDLKLKSYQRADAAFMALSRQALLANDVGLGKSPVTIRALQLLQEMSQNPFPALVVCPNSLKYTVWEKEFTRWAPELTVQVVDGPIAKRRKQLKETADVFVVNWELLRIHSRLAPYGSGRLTPKQKEPKELNELGHRTIVMDEAHRLGAVGSVKRGDERVPKSLQAQAAWAVAHQAEFRFALTGTPIADHVGDLWGLEHGVLPDWFPARTKYLDRYAQVTLSFWGGTEITGLNPANEAEFHKVVDPTFRRIPKKLALPELPGKLPLQYRHTPMTPRQAQLYQQMEDELVALLDDEGGYVAAPTQLAQLTRLLQFASASATLDEEGKVKLSAPSAKVNDLVELLGEMGEEPLVVASVSRQLIELAAAKLTALDISHGLITGRVSSFSRQEVVESFQSGKIRVILMTTGAGAEGITLTRADTMLFMSRSWRQLENTQAEGRIDRIGAEQHVCLKIIEQITPGTVEERKISVLAGKSERAEEVLRDRESLRRLLGQD